MEKEEGHLTTVREAQNLAMCWFLKQKESTWRTCSGGETLLVVDLGVVDAFDTLIGRFSTERAGRVADLSGMCRRVPREGAEGCENRATGAGEAWAQPEKPW